MKIFLMIFICFVFLFFWGRRSGYTPPPDLWKEIDELMPSLQRFKKLDRRAYNDMERELELMKREKEPEIASRHLMRAVDHFSVLTTLLPSGDSPYHEEIGNLSSELAILGDKILMEVAENAKRPYEPKVFNSLLN